MWSLRRDVKCKCSAKSTLQAHKLQDTFGVIMLSLVNGEPKVLNLWIALTYYLKHQRGCRHKKNAL